MSAFLSRGVCFSIWRFLLFYPELTAFLSRDVSLSSYRVVFCFVSRFVCSPICMGRGCLSASGCLRLSFSWTFLSACLSVVGGMPVFTGDLSACIYLEIVSCPKPQRCFLPVSSGGFISLVTEACSFRFVLSATLFGRLVVCPCLCWLHVWPVEKC